MSRAGNDRVGLTTTLAMVTLIAALLSACDEVSSSSSSTTSSSAAPPRGDASQADAAPSAADPVVSAAAASEVPSLSPGVAADASYARVLAGVVTDEGLVRYSVLDQEPLSSELQATVAGYAAAELPSESEPKARLALWCNAYNANVLKMAGEERRQPGFTTVKDAPGFFDQRPIVVAGETLTLTALKDRICAVNDARIHAALVSAAISDPALRNEPYSAAALDQQLDNQCFAWLDDLAKNRVMRSGLQLSQIFEMHAEDFAHEPYGGVLGFVKKQGRPRGTLRDFIRSVPTLDVRYIPHNYALNEAPEQ